jgi:hypothetical protein
MLKHATTYQSPLTPSRAHRSLCSRYTNMQVLTPATLACYIWQDQANVKYHTIGRNTSLTNHDESCANQSVEARRVSWIGDFLVIS